jgi:hypothetical protein
MAGLLIKLEIWRAVSNEYIPTCRELCNALLWGGGNNWCFTIYFVEFFNHTQLSYLHTTVAVRTDDAHTPVCFSRQTNDFLGDVASVAPILSARVVCVLSPSLERDRLGIRNFSRKIMSVMGRGHLDNFRLNWTQSLPNRYLAYTYAVQKPTT